VAAKAEENRVKHHDQGAIRQVSSGAASGAGAPFARDDADAAWEGADG